MVDEHTWRKAGICAAGGTAAHILGYLAEAYTGEQSAKDFIHLLQRTATFAVPYAMAEYSMDNDEDKPVKYGIEILTSILGVNSVLGNIGHNLGNEYSSQHFSEWAHKNILSISGLSALIPGIKPFKRELESRRQNP